MRDTWSEFSVAELQRKGVLLVEDGNHGEYRPRPHEFVDEGVAFIRAADMDSGRVLFESASRISEVARRRITKGVGAPGDVLLSHKGTVGKVAFVSDDAPPFVCSPQTTFWRSLNSDVLDRRYLYALLRSPYFQAQLRSRAGETDMAPYVSLTAQRELRVVVPPLGTQRRIGDVLGALDNKIELNRRMNETLEAIARALFEEKFSVDKRDLPTGWTLGTIGDVAANLRRSVSPHAIEANTPYIGLEHMPRRSIALDQWDSAIVASNKLRFLSGEILFGKLRPYFHKVGIAPVDGVCSTDILVLAAQDPVWFGFVLEHVSSEAMIRFVDSSSTGTKMPRTTWSEIARFEVGLPPQEEAAAFTDTTLPMFNRIRFNIFESRILTELRDTLLPKFLSGKLRVRDAEKEVATAV